MASNRVGIQGHIGKNEDKGERGDARSQGQIGFQGTRGPEGGLKPKGKDIFQVQFLNKNAYQDCLTFHLINLTLKACPHQANAKAKIFFDVCRLFF